MTFGNFSGSSANLEGKSTIIVSGCEVVVRVIKKFIPHF